ncbi:MAG: hypothetical protein J6X97_03240 [Lachnospiraceae bacterium]|nr:hypothetical protein [Lachnospiraceae bacterium]
MTAKRFVTRLTAVTLAFCVTFLFSCAPKKIDVDEYPGFETIEETETENTVEKNTIPVEDIVENGGMTTKEFEEFISIPDPFEETGKFQFYPEAIPECYARQYRENPKVIYVAKQMMKAVYDCKTEFEIPPEYQLNYDETYNAINIARMSCPLLDACEFGTLTDNPLVYSVIYNPKSSYVLDEEGNIDEDQIGFTQLNDEEARKMVVDFTDYVQTIIDNNISKDDSDMEKAEKIYEAIVKEISYREKRQYEEQHYFYSDEEIAEAANSQTTIVEDLINENATTQTRIALFYQYILTQLNIECMTVTSSGAYTSQGIERLDNEMNTTGRNIWNVIVVDGKAYNCDLAFDMLNYEYEKSENPNYEPVMKYFGMSDKTRADSFNVLDRGNLYIYDPTVDYSWDTPKKDMVPECKQDYK